MSYDRVKTTTTTTGTGNITVSASAAARCRPLSDIPVGKVVSIMIEDEAGTDWELSKCTVLTATTFSRDTVLKGSNGTSKVNFAAGTKTVFQAVTADQYNDFALLSTGVESSGLDPAGALTGADIMAITQGGVEKRTTLTAIAAAIASINGAGGGGPSAATAVTMTGPSGGVSGVASTNFTVGVSPVGGAISGTITVTPSANGGGGTFAPTSIALTGAQPTGTFTYTPASAGAKTISVTNSASLTAPANITYTATASATAPAAPTIGTAVAGDGYVDVAFTRNSNGGSAVLDSTATLSTGQTATGASSPIRVTAPNGVAVTATVKDRNAIGSSAASAASNSVTPAAAGGTAYTIVGFGGNTVKSPIDASAATVYGSIKLINPASQGTKAGSEIYWSINAVSGGAQPASARSGWGTSSTVPPAEITDAQNASSGTSVNGLSPMGKASAFTNNSRLWVPVGFVGDMHFWVKPNDGPAQMVGSATITGA